MTHVDHIQGTLSRPVGAAKIGYPYLIACVALLAALCVSLPNLADPMIRFDDYPAYFADPTQFYMKTLSEGRWVNYWWHLRGFVTPSWVNFAVYQTFWATFAASLAYAAMRSDPDRTFGPILAVLIVVAPPATMISLWFNTLLPGLGLVALYAVLGLVLSQWLHRALLPLFVIAGFMAYTTYPLLLLTVCLVCTKRRSWTDLAGLLGLFVLSFAAALMVAYGLNYQAHGVFGIELSDWREANAAATFGQAMSNFPIVLESFRAFLRDSSYAFPPVAVFHLLMLTVACAVLARHKASEALYLGIGLAFGLAFITLQCLKTGAIAPNRAFVFAWVIYVILVVRAAQILCSQGGLAARLAKNCVFLILGLYVLQTFVQYSSYRDWQSQTKRIFEGHPNAAQPLLVDGDVLTMASAQKARIQDPVALVFRAQQLGVLNVALCSDDRSKCEGSVELLINLDDL